MSLFIFESKQEAENTELIGNHTYIENVKNEYRQIFKNYQKIEDLFPDLEPGTNIHFVSEVDWSNHELIAHLLTITGPANIWFTTFALSEAAARILLKLKQNNQILEMTALVDFRAQNRHPEAYHLAKSLMANIRQYPNHSKVTVIENNDWQIVINSSANFTNNMRIESGIICVNTGATTFYKNWINNLIIHGELFEDEKQDLH
jgi:hypothetical protein